MARFRDDANFVALASMFGHRELWNKRSRPPTRLASLIGHAKGIQAVAFNFQNSCVDTGGADETLRILGFEG
jgi:hypothetical protein